MSWSNFRIKVVYDDGSNTPIENAFVYVMFKDDNENFSNYQFTGYTGQNGIVTVTSTPETQDYTKAVYRCFDERRCLQQGDITSTITNNSQYLVYIDLEGPGIKFFFTYRMLDALYAAITNFGHKMLTPKRIEIYTKNLDETYSLYNTVTASTINFNDYFHTTELLLKPYGANGELLRSSAINYKSAMFGGMTLPYLCEEYYDFKLPLVNDTINWQDYSATLRNVDFEITLTYDSVPTPPSTITLISSSNEAYLRAYLNDRHFGSGGIIPFLNVIDPSLNIIKASKNHYNDSEKNIFISATTLNGEFSEYVIILSGETIDTPIILEREPNVCMINEDLYDYVTSLVPELNLDSGVTANSYTYFYEREKVGTSYLDFYRFWCDTIGIAPTSITSLNDFKENFVDSIATNFVRTNYALNQTIEDQFLINSRHGYVFDRCFIPISGEPLTQNYLTFAPSNGVSQAPSSYVSLNKDGNPTSVDMQYRVGNGTWNSYNIGTPIYFTSSTISFRRNPSNSGITFSYDEENYYYFSFGGETAETPSFITYGSVTSLLDGLGENDTEMGDWCFVNLFIDCDKLRNASQLELPSEELSSYCYYGMFAGCTILNGVPELPATELKESCYVDMFYNCRSLSQAPELPATVLAPYCYYGMFGNCISLSQAPELPASSLTIGCYGYMFNNCVSLEEMPYLSAETLSDRCYESMFRGCSALTIAHDLPSNEIKNYACQYMFKDCVSLVTPPIFIKGSILGGRLYALNGMFENCSMLESYPFNNPQNIAYLAALDKYCFQGMFKNCTSLKNLPLKIWCDNAKDYSFKEMFKGCTSIDINLGNFEITSNNLGTLSGVCESMFEGCVLLSSGITTNSIKIGPDCYKNMFKNCTSLSYIKQNFSATTSGVFNSTNADEFTENWVYNVSSSGTFITVNGTWFNSYAFYGPNGIPNNSGWRIGF